MADKANGSWRFYGGIQELGLTPGNETMTEITAAMPNRSTLVYYVGAVSNVSEYPSKYGVVEVVRHSDYRITSTFTASLSVFPKYWVGSATIDGFTGWVPQATATPPEEHALPLMEGWTAGRSRTKFCISQNSLVLVTFGVSGPANTSDRAVIAQLPPGFRPGELISTECIVTETQTYTRYAAGLDVNRAGEVIVFSKQPGWTIAVGQVAFYVSA